MNKQNKYNLSIRREEKCRVCGLKFLVTLPRDIAKLENTDVSFLQCPRCDNYTKISKNSKLEISK